MKCHGYAPPVVGPKKSPARYAGLRCWLAAGLDAPREIKPTTPATSYAPDSHFALPLPYMAAAMLRQRTFPAGFIAPCLPTKAKTPPSGGRWLHEIKHDGFRVIARKDGDRIRLYSRPGNDRFPLIVDALVRLRSRSCIIDGEAVACDDRGVPSFDRIRYRRNDAKVFLYAFDLIELNGDDMRRDPLEARKATLASVLVKAASGLRFNEHIEHDDGETVFRHACKMGLEGVVSKRKGSPYRSGRSSDWLKMKNPACAAVKREAEEDWGR
jgi:bifunctional non-homologous end joining protein LigD